MRTDGAIITNAGQELLSYALANNKQVNFTKVKLGKGDVNTFDEAKKLTDVVSFYKQIPITSIARNNAGVVRIRSSFTNADFPLQVVLKEIGVFAVVEGKSEVLFGYVNDGEGESFPPGSSGNIVERVRDIYVGVSTNTQVTAVVDRSVVYATIYDLDEEIAKCAKKITRVNPGNGIHGGGTLGEDITVSIKSNDTSINLDATNGITLKKTTSWLNDTAQLFTAKGALNLFNTLTTNFTDAINTAKEALRLDISKKVSKSGDTMTDNLNISPDGKGVTFYGGGKITKKIGQGLAIDMANSTFMTIDSLGEMKVKVDDTGEIWANGGTQIVYNAKNRPIVDTEENNSNKILSAKGALNLKNWLVSNYTTLMNNIRDTLTNMINTKTPHGGYSQTTQQLKNEVDTKVGITTVANHTEQQIKDLPTGIYQCSQCIIGTYNGEDIYPYGTMQVYKQGSQSIQIYTTYYSQIAKNIYGTFMRRTDDNGAFREFYKVYDSAQKPTPSDIGAVSKTGDTMTENLNISGDDKYVAFHDGNKIGKKSGQGLSFFFNQSGFITFDTYDGIALKLDKYGILTKGNGDRYISENITSNGNVINFNTDGTFLNFMGCTFGKKVGTGMTMKFADRVQNFQFEDRNGYKTLDISEDGTLRKFYNNGVNAYNYMHDGNIKTDYGKSTEILWSGNLTTGNFVLSKPYDQFDAICFVGGENIVGRRYSNVIPSVELNSGSLEILGLPSYSSGSNFSCWQGSFSADKRTFVTGSETGTILAVYGIKYGV